MSIVVSVQCVWESHTPSPCHMSHVTFITRHASHMTSRRTPLVDVDKPNLVRADSAQSQLSRIDFRHHFVIRCYKIRFRSCIHSRSSVEVHWACATGGGDDAC